MIKERKKSWSEKVKLVQASFHRCTTSKLFAQSFYKNLFYLNPDIENYFKETDWKQQEIALHAGVGHILSFLDKNDKAAKNNVERIAESHSKDNMNIHPHDYYYWIDALIMTAKECDHKWYDDLQYYWREVIFYPVSYIISRYFSKFS